MENEKKNEGKNRERGGKKAERKGRDGQRKMAHTVAATTSYTNATSYWFSGRGVEERGWNGGGERKRETERREREGGGTSKVERRREKLRGRKGWSDWFFVVNHRG